MKIAHKNQHQKISTTVLIVLLGFNLCMAQTGMTYLRTPDSRFDNLDGYNFTPHYFYVDDYEGGQLRMHYIDEGPVDSPVVIMIHGNPTWIYQFRQVIPQLNAAGYRTIAIDLIGMGRSDKPTDSSDYSYDRHVGWLTQLFTKMDSALNLEQVTIFGHDYGTPMGIRMMVEHFPDRFDAFIDANASLPDGTYISPVHLNWRQFVRDNPNVPIGHVIAGSVNDTLTPAEIYGYYAPWPDSTYKMAVRTFPEMVPDDTSRPEAIANNAAWSVMESFNKPFMTIFGMADNEAFDARREFIERVPGAYGQPQPQLQVTHYAPEDDPDAVAAEIITFLNDVYHPDTFINLQFSEFASDFDGFSPGGSDCTYEIAEQAVRIQGNNGVSSSLIQADSMDLTVYDVLKIAFRYEAESMEDGEVFFMEMWDGTNWQNLLTLTAGTDFANNIWDYGFVRINKDSINFADDAKIRFRCAASNSDDAIYLMDVGIFARRNTITKSENQLFTKEAIQLFPNPAESSIHIKKCITDDIHYKLMNAKGQIIDCGYISATESSLNISGLPAGVYFISILRKEGSITTSKFMKY